MIPSTGFYEWRDFNKKKYPYFISLKDQPIFSMAGIYENWKDRATGQTFNTFSIVTCQSNPMMGKIHVKERMPVILTPEDGSLWLRGDLNSEGIKALMHPLDEKFMIAHTVSKLLSSKLEKTDVPQVMEEAIYAELPILALHEKAPAN